MMLCHPSILFKIASTGFLNRFSPLAALHPSLSLTHTTLDLAHHTVPLSEVGYIFILLFLPRFYYYISHTFYSSIFPCPPAACSRHVYPLQPHANPHLGPCTVIQEKRLDISFHIPHRSPSYLGLTVLFLFYFMACSTVSKIQNHTLAIPSIRGHISGR